MQINDHVKASILFLFLATLLLFIGVFITFSPLIFLLILAGMCFIGIGVALYLVCYRMITGKNL
jgi:hypothetical protein